MIMEPYSELFIPVHIVDLSKIRSRRDISEVPVPFNFDDESVSQSEAMTIISKPGAGSSSIKLVKDRRQLNKIK